MVQASGVIFEVENEVGSGDLNKTNPGPIAVT